MKTFLPALLLLLCLNANAQCWNKIDGGYFYTVGIKDNGTLWSWGDTEQAAILGLGPIPVQIGTAANWTAVSAGHSHVLALKTDGTLWAWGYNIEGQIGNGEIGFNAVSAPIQIGTDTDWAYIYAGYLSSYAIKANGTLWSWGSNKRGQLGNGLLDAENQQSQTIVPTQAGTANNWKEVSGQYLCVGIRTNGTLWEWGDNGQIPMTNGSTVPVTTPVQVGTATDWKTASAGMACASAIKNDGSLWSWGINNYGSLGNGTFSNSIQPIQVSNDVWLSVEQGFGASAAGIKQDNTLWSWGSSFYGQVGNGMTGYFPSPQLIAPGTQWKQYTSAEFYSVGITNDNRLMVWGSNYGGSIGFNLSGDIIAAPVQAEACATAGTDENILAQVGIYPNPAVATIYLANAERLTVNRLMITDGTGKIVTVQNGNPSGIDVHHLPNGLYFLSIVTDSGTTHKKFVKQ